MTLEQLSALQEINDLFAQIQALYDELFYKYTICKATIVGMKTVQERFKSLERSEYQQLYVKSLLDISALEMKVERLFEKAHDIGSKTMMINKKVQTKAYKDVNDINTDWEYLITVPEKLENFIFQFESIIGIKEKRELK